MTRETRGISLGSGRRQAPVIEEGGRSDRLGSDVIAAAPSTSAKQRVLIQCIAAAWVKEPACPSARVTLKIDGFDEHDRDSGDRVANFIYVDNSNVWIEGMHVATVASGLASDIQAAMSDNVCDYEWKLDFGRLYQFAGGDTAGRAVLFGSRPPANDSLWTVAKNRGFEVIVYDRSIRNKEKKVDTSVATEIMADSYERMASGRDEVTLVAGDGDYVPTVENLRGRGFSVFVAFWDHASRELKESASSFISLNPYLDHLSL